MKICRLFYTIIELKIVQLLFRVLNKIPRNYKEITRETHTLYYFRVNPVPKIDLLDNELFSFINIESKFINWSATQYGMLWAYNLNYMDWLNQEGMTYEEGAKWIDKFIDDLPGNRVGLDPYPIALRGINWIKFICKYYDKIDAERLKRWNGSLYSQYRLLEKKLERHLLGNHLLEDAYSLYIASIYFNNQKMFNRYSRLLRTQLNEQILPDGAHYEQSPMYHCILLDRLLDCCNISFGNVLFPGQIEYNSYIKDKAIQMLGHLESIVYSNGDIPLLNDSAYGIAPSAEQLFDYARRLGIDWDKQSLTECGYRRMIADKYEAIVDVGNMIASYQPGHSHADSLNYELRIDGKPYIVDTGISTYEKNERRQYERSTVAHNTVSIANMDSSEVWGGFRVGKRCNTKILEDTENRVTAWHNGFDKPCKRRFEISESGFVVEDWYAGDAVSYIHIAEDADLQRIYVEGTNVIEVRDCQYSTEYNRFHNGRVLEIHFTGYLKYTIR